ncbi:MAG: glycosyltransferase family 4 protein [Actinomycetota bacterium]|nr:glycosyltransferase family 4 protein [Actinomycetota bacterium]
MRATALRVAFVLPRASPRPIGALKIIYSLADELAQRGHSVALAHATADAPDPHPWHAPHPAVRSVVVPHLPTRWSGPAVDAIIATSWLTVPWIASYPPRAGCKVYFLQNYETFQLGSDAERAAMRGTFRVGWPMIVTSPPLRRLVQPHARGPLTEIPCAIDTDLFTVTTPLDSPERVMLGFPARRERAKRLADAVAAMERLRTELSACPPVWCFGPEPFPEIPRWIVQHPNLDTATLCVLYNRTKIFVVPSEVERSGCPAWRRWPAGRHWPPPATAASTPTPTRGRRCCARQPARLATVVRLLLDDDERRQRLAAAGAASAVRFTWSATADAFETFLVRHANPAMEGPVTNRSDGIGERARLLHERALVVDTLAGGPGAYTPRMLAELETIATIESTADMFGRLSACTPWPSVRMPSLTSGERSSKRVWMC